MRALTAIVVLAGCTDATRIAPVVRVVSDSHLVTEAAYVWEPVGFGVEFHDAGRSECPRFWFNPRDGSVDTECVITIHAELEDGPAGGRADVHTRTIYIDPGHDDYDLWLVSAHEIGHILTDADHLRPEQDGLMHGSITSSYLTRDDRDFICEEIHLCQR